MLDGYVEYKDIATLTGYTEGYVGVLLRRIRLKASAQDDRETSSTINLILKTQNNSNNIVRKKSVVPYKYEIDR